jgi:hypothetical protein
MFGRYFSIRDCLKATITAVFLTATVGSICKASIAQVPPSSTPYWEVVEVRTGNYTASNSQNPQLPPSLPYALPTNSYIAAGPSTNVNGSGNSASAGLQGGHKFTFTWKGGASNAPRPKNVVVKIDASARWGLPMEPISPSPPSPPDCTVEGGEGTLVVNEVTLPKTANNPANMKSIHKVWYSVKNNPPATFDITVNVTAKASAVGGTSPNSQGDVSVGSSASVALSSVNMKLEGTAASGGLDYILIGQGCRASWVMLDNGKKPSSSGGYGSPTLTQLDGVGVTLDPSGYNWIVSGNTFGGFYTDDMKPDPINPSLLNPPIPLPLPTGFVRTISNCYFDGRPHRGIQLPAQLQGASPLWFWKETINKGIYSDETVKGEGKIKINNNQIGNIEEIKNIRLVTPESDCGSYMGYVKIIGAVFGLYNDTSTSSNPDPFSVDAGMRIWAWADTSRWAPFSSGAGTGSINALQLARHTISATMNTTATADPNFPTTFVTVDVMGLDTLPISLDAPWCQWLSSPTDRSMFWMGDSPLVELGGVHLWNALTCEQSFGAITWIMYNPQDNGLGTTWVPLWKKPWWFSGIAEKATTWSIVSSNAGYDATEWLPSFPSWGRMIKN